MHVMTRSSDSGDTTAIAAVKNCGGGLRMRRRRGWFSAGFIEWVMHKERSKSLVLRNLVVYFGALVGAVGISGVGFLMRLCLHAAMSSSSIVLLLSVLGVGLVKDFCTLIDGVVITGTLRDEVMSNSVRGGGIGCVFDTLGDVCVLLISSVCVKHCGCLVRDIVWAVGAWRLIKLLATLASCLRSLIDISPFPFDMPLVDFSIFWIALTVRI